ncbi:cupin domain-containing protein [Nostoc sp.]|uniref:cupin domain-containing protein n=1 Tax=Nostoc sp. TaxID=1180 RepID=UPI002FF5171C
MNNYFYMLLKKKLSLMMAGTVLFAFCFEQKAAQANLTNHVHDDSPLVSKVHNQDVLVVPPDASNRPAYYSAGTLNTLLATGKDTNGTFSLLDIVSLPQIGTPPHIHTREDELYYILKGQVTFELGSLTGPQSIVANPGTFAFLPKNKPHRWQNTGTTLSELLVFPFPSGFEGFIIDQNQPVTDRSAPIPLSPVTPEILTIAEKYGLKLISGSPSDFYEDHTKHGLEHIIVPPGMNNRPSFTEAGAVFTSLVNEEETGGQVSLFDVDLVPQSGFQNFIGNEQQNNAFYVLDGDITFQIDNTITHGAPGTFVYLPKGESYSLRNLGTTSARTLFLETPTPVPEPTFTFGLLASAALGSVSLFNRMSKK